MFNDLFRGKVWKFEDNISTDLMMPSFLVDKGGQVSLKEKARYCMSANRPGWAAQVSFGEIIVAGRNFGCGSSRPAAEYLQTLGISIVVAESMSRIFFRNAINLGFPVLICRGAHEAFTEGDVAEIDLARGLVKNLTRGTALNSDVLPMDSPPMQILRAGGIMALLEKEFGEQK